MVTSIVDDRQGREREQVHDRDGRQPTRTKKRVDRERERESEIERHAHRRDSLPFPARIHTLLPETPDILT